MARQADAMNGHLGHWAIASHPFIPQCIQLPDPCRNRTAHVPVRETPGHWRHSIPSSPFSPVRFVQDLLRNAGMFRVFLVGEFLCGPDCVAEQAVWR